MNKKSEFFRMSRDVDTNDSEASYYSCHELEGAVTFIHGAITMCGHVHSTNKGMPFISEYKGGDIPIDIIKKARADLIKKNQTDEDTPCKGCQFLQKANWKQNDHLIDNITIGYYTPCNLRCSYCYITSYSQEEEKKFNIPPYNMTDTLKKLIDNKLLASNCTAWLTGGEPTSFIDFKEIMTLLVDNNIKTTIGTNCTRKPIDIVRKGLQNGNVEILCSVDAGTRETYKEVKGRDRYEDVWKNIKEYNNINDKNVVIKYIFMDNNCSENEVIEFINMCQKTNVKNISISRDILQYEGALSSEQKQMPISMYTSMALMYKKSIELKINVFFDINWPVFNNTEIVKIKELSENV